ncbi:MAG: discoidin domain-containing protein [Myxococcales bacterium]|nr:discoidin domain-containing protein [Myxococcales bacterium]
MRNSECKLGVALLAALAGCAELGGASAPELARGESALALPPDGVKQCSSTPCVPNLARGATITVSSTTGSSASEPDTRWTANRAVDGSRDSIDGALGWSSMAAGSELTTEWIQLDFGFPRTVSDVQLYARNDATFGSDLGDGFPRDFVIEISEDAVTWAAVVVQANYPVPEDELQDFKFPPVAARFLRVLATRLDSVAGGSYHFQLGEIEVYDNPGELDFTFQDDERVELIIEDGDVLTSEDVAIGEATELDDLLAGYQAYLDEINAPPPPPPPPPPCANLPVPCRVEPLPVTGGRTTDSAGINTNQRCKFWQVGCWKRRIIDARWPNNTVFYEFHRKVSDTDRTTIRNIIADWNNRVGVTWVEDTSRFSRVMFKVKNLRNACGNSIVGRSGLPQKIRIDPDCVGTRTVQHEMGHAVGLIHEQQRCDRDSYVSVSSNDRNNRRECAAKLTTFGPYDYSAVMHYFDATGRTPQPSGSVGNPASPGGFQLGCHDRLGIHKLYGFAGGPPPGSTDAAVCNLARSSTVTVSSTTGTSPTNLDTRWTLDRAVDGNRHSVNPSFGWSSLAAATATTVQFIQYQFPGQRRVHRVDLYPRDDATFGSVVGDGFPVDFTIDTSDDGATWTPVVTRTGYGRPGASVQTFEFAARSATFLRVRATRLRSVGGPFFFQIAEIEVF